VRLELAPRVESDLTDIGEYIALHNPIRARTFVDELIAQIERIGQYPFSYRLRPDIGTEARAAVHQNYLILFRIVGEVVRVERVVHGRRDLPKLFP
jgi:toxin ParE1/3/4